jgi:hypothetical protein
MQNTIIQGSAESPYDSERVPEEMCHILICGDVSVETDKNGASSI